METTSIQTIHDSRSIVNSSSNYRMLAIHNEIHSYSERQYLYRASRCPTHSRFSNAWEARDHPTTPCGRGTLREVPLHRPAPTHSKRRNEWGTRPDYVPDSCSRYSFIKRSATSSSRSTLETWARDFPRRLFAHSLCASRRDRHSRSRKAWSR